MEITIVKNEGTENMKALNELFFGTPLSSTKGNHNVLVNGELAGFIQIVPFNYESFIEGYFKNEEEEYKPIILNEEDYILLENFYLLPSFQRKGIGKRVIEDLKSHSSKEILLYSLAEAEEFWLNMGFQDNCDYVYTYPNNLPFVHNPHYSEYMV